MRDCVAEVWKHFRLTLIYFSLLAAAYGLWNGWSRQVLFLWVGALIGAEVLDVDHLIYIFLTYRKTPTSLEARRLAREKKFGQVIAYIERYHKEFLPVHLVCHNGIMQMVFCAFTLLMIMGGGSLFWTGLGMSLLLHLLKDEWEDMRNDPPRLRAYIFRHFPRAPLFAVRAFVCSMAALFAVFSVLIVVHGR